VVQVTALRFLIQFPVPGFKFPDQTNHSYI
jgi:hypothetical protein